VRFMLVILHSFASSLYGVSGSIPYFEMLWIYPMVNELPVMNGQIRKFQKTAIRT
jgi:hypothetical protein